MAIELPRASPSGRACEVTTKRCRPRIASTMCRRSRSVVVTIYTRKRFARRRVGVAIRHVSLPPLVLFVELAQNLLDTILMADRFVELKLEFGNAPQPQAIAEMAPEKPGRALERLRRLHAGGIVAEAGVIDARLLQVGGHLHARQRDEADARVVHRAAAEQPAQLLPDLVADAIWSESQNLHRYSDALHREDFDHVADLDVVVIRQADAALEARLHLADVVLEAAQRSDLAFVHDDVVAQQAGLRFAGACDAPFGHHAAGNGADLRHLEDLAHVGAAEAHLLERRFEKTGHAFLDLLGHVIDDRVEPDVDLLAFRHVLRVAIRADVEPDDDGVRRRRQQHVRLVDGADAGADDADLDSFVGELRQRIGEHFGRPLHVGLDDERQFLHAAFGDLILQRLQRESPTLGAECTLLGLALAEHRDLARLGGIRHDLERIARLGQARQAEYFDRRRRSSRFDRPSAVVDQGTDLADDWAGNEVVADAERAVLHEDGRHRAAAAIQLGFQHRARGA